MMCRFSFSDPICHVMEVPLKPGFHMICNGLRSVYDTAIMVGKVELDSTFPAITTVSQTDRRPMQIIWKPCLTKCKTSCSLARLFHDFLK